MFGDFGWNSTRADSQMRRMRAWLSKLEEPTLAIVECGAGRAVPTVRITCEDIARRFGGTLIRINTREPDVPSGGISVPAGALAALEAIDARLNERSG